MIARMVYVMCDACGRPAALADDRKEARQLARGEHFTCVPESDLCADCSAPGVADGAAPSLRS